MIGALMILPFLAFCLLLGAASIKPRPGATSPRRRTPARPATPRASQADPEPIVRTFVSAPTPTPTWTELDELQLTRLLRDESPPAAPPGAVR